MNLFLLRWLASSISLLVVVSVLPGIQAESVWSVVATALVLGIVNATVRPVLILLTLPMTIMSLGLFLLVLNGALFYVVGIAVKGFAIRNYWWALLGATLYSVINAILGVMIRKD